MSPCPSSFGSYANLPHPDPFPPVWTAVVTEAGRIQKSGKKREKPPSLTTRRCHADNGSASLLGSSIDAATHQAVRPGIHTFQVHEDPIWHLYDGRWVSSHRRTSARAASSLHLDGFARRAGHWAAALRIGS
ncbi:hypothetical protein CSAL01_02684 [Colletotrichum salicis]|uniref:Uncharacterized protein n=1 Tax=Colletotrichum salicis TaxID=1209931 RepID=A0A135SK64_9PEZI|nr:hypothetical protein CSAL01_02684 [Colletotrichum salicis]